MDLLKEIWAAMRRNKLRTSLTGFAVAWGIFMLIFLLGAGNGLINAQMQGQDRWLGSSMMVFGGSTSVPYDGLKEGRSIELKDIDLKSTRQVFAQNVKEVGAMLSQPATVSYGKEYVAANLTGVYPNDMEINKRKMLAGRFVNNGDLREMRKVAVVSQDHAKQLAGHWSRIMGKYVKVNGIAFRVVGVMVSDRQRQSSDVFTAFTTVQKMYGKGDKAGNIEFMFSGVNTIEENNAFDARYRAVINRNHRAAPHDQSAVWLWNRNSMSMQMAEGVGLLRKALWVVGLFTLLSGVVGVSNIMLITVKERRREFGIRKAIGAKPVSILWLIITESVIITAVFGYFGMLCGIAANEYMNATIGNMTVDSGLFKLAVFLNPTVGLDVCAGATVVIIVAGTIAGLVPAWKAAVVRPIEALRAE